MRVVQHRERQRCLQYAKLAIATYRRHKDGRPVEHPESMREAVEFVIEECGRTGLPIPPSVTTTREELNETRS